jgi:transposase, IS30 family
MSYQKLTLEERYQIMALNKSKISVREMASILGRHPSTISRELRRNSEYTRNNYRAGIAHKKYLKRRSVIHRPLKIQGELATEIFHYLSMQWSPEQISGRLKRRGTEICHETIYRHIFKNYQFGGRIYQNLRRGRKRRRSHKVSRIYKSARKNRDINPISKRPKIVEQRKRIGDFERDTVQGKFKGPVLLTIVDRVSRITKIKKLPWLNSEATHEATIQLLKDLPVKTITNDNGSEFSAHKETATALNTKIFFNDPYASWQRGTNENTNGLIRQYYPKGTDFNLVSDEDVKKLEGLLNNRPRKTLGYRTPNEVLKSRIRVLH